MSSRPRRTAATKAKETISVYARRADSTDREETKSSEPPSRHAMTSRRANRAPPADVSMSSQLSDDDDEVAGRGPSTKNARGTATRRGLVAEAFEGGEIIHGKRDRGGKKTYVVESSPDAFDDDDEEEDEAQAELDDEDDEEMEDAEGEEDVEMDAEGDVDMDVAPPATSTTIKITHNALAKSSKPQPQQQPDDDEDDDDDDDDELSDPGESDGGDQTLGFGDETLGDDDEDAEGEDDMDVTGVADGAGGDDSEEDDEVGELDLNKMTKRQRARFEDGPQEFMKLSDGENSSSSLSTFLPVSCGKD